MVPGTLGHTSSETEGEVGGEDGVRGVLGGTTRNLHGAYKNGVSEV